MLCGPCLPVLPQVFLGALGIGSNLAFLGDELGNRTCERSSVGQQSLGRLGGVEPSVSARHGATGDRPVQE